MGMSIHPCIHHMMQRGRHTVQHGRHTVQRSRHTVQRGHHTVQRGRHTVQRGRHTMQRGHFTVRHGRHTVHRGCHMMQRGHPLDAAWPPLMAGFPCLLRLWRVYKFDTMMEPSLVIRASLSPFEPLTFFHLVEHPQVQPRSSSN